MTTTHLDAMPPVQVFAQTATTKPVAQLNRMQHNESRGLA
jgi:hypothetical protein